MPRGSWQIEFSFSRSKIVDINVPTDGFAPIQVTERYADVSLHKSTAKTKKCYRRSYCLHRESSLTIWTEHGSSSVPTSVHNENNGSEAQYTVSNITNEDIYSTRLRTKTHDNERNMEQFDHNGRPASVASSVNWRPIIKRCSKYRP